jgi:hypothetical protein
MTLIFFRGIENHTSFPLVLVGAPRKGQASGWVTPWITPGLPYKQVGLRCAFWQASPDRSPPSSLSSFRPKCHRPCSLQYARWPHHKHGWCGLTRLTSPAKYNNGVRKHRVVRSVQTELNTRPKPRASAYERGLTNLITSQNTYANHQIYR